MIEPSAQHVANTQAHVQGRDDVVNLATALDLALADVEPRCCAATVSNLAASTSGRKAGDAGASLETWDAAAALAGEREVWRTAQAELQRQAALLCRERGELLQRVHARQDDMLNVRPPRYTLLSLDLGVRDIEAFMVTFAHWSRPACSAPPS